MQLSNPAMPICVVDSIKDLVSLNTTLWFTESTFLKLVNLNNNLRTTEHQCHVDKLDQIQSCLWQHKEVDYDVVYDFILFATTNIDYPLAYIVISKSMYYNNSNINLVFATIDQFNDHCDRMKQLWLSQRKL